MMTSWSGGVLTAESLVQDCVGRYITTGRGALRLTNLINSKSYAEAWAAVQQWAQRHFALGNSFILSPIGVLQKGPGAVPQFAFFQSFIDKFGLETANVARDTDPNTVVKMYTSSVAKYAPDLDRDRLKLALQHLFQRLGEVIASRSQCLIEFGFATLVAEDRRVAMVLHVRPDDGTQQDDVVEGQTQAKSAVQHRQKRARYTHIGAKPREGMAWVLKHLEMDHDSADVEVGAGRPRSGMESLGHGDLSTRLGRRTLSPGNRIAMIGRCPSPPRLRDLPEHDRNLYPPVLDAFSRTRAATFSSGHSAMSLSAKIASYYTPEARLWSFKSGSNRLLRLLLEKSTMESNSMPTFHSIMIDSGPNDDQTLRERYEYYIYHGIDKTHIAPIRDEWIHNVLRLLNLDLGSVQPNQVQHLTREMLAEMHSHYELSVCRAIVDYILRDPAERVRLKIKSASERTVTDWGSCRSLPSPPIEWRPEIHQAWVHLNAHLHTMNPAALAILQAWQKHESFSLIWTPDNSQLPISIHDFESRQKTYLKDQVSHFYNDWMREIENIVRGQVDVKDGPVFESLATLMTNLLRGVVERSAQQFHQFLTRFSNANDVTFAPDQIASILNIIQDDHVVPGMLPIFAIKLVIQRRKIQLQVLPNEVESAVGRILDAILNSFDSLPRVETKLYPLLDNPKTLALRVDDAQITGLRDDIVRVFRQSAASAQSIVSLYDEHAYLLDETQRLADWVTQPRTLNELRERIDSFRTLANDLTMKTRDMVRCGMLALDGSKVNEMLVGKASDLSKQILQYIASRNIEHNVLICDEFKAVSAVLLKKPTSSKELVELVRYSNSFKQTTLKRLLGDCANSADELRFLFDCDHLVNDEVLNHFGSAFSWAKKIDTIISEADIQLMNERRKMEGQFEARKDKFSKLLDSYSAQIADLAEFTDVKREAEFNTIIRNLKENLVASGDEAKRIQEQDELLGMPISEFSQLEESKLKLVPFEELWLLVQEFRQHHTNWTDGPVFNLNAEHVKSKCESMWRMAVKLSRQLTVAAGSVAANIKTVLDQFKVNLPLVEILCNPGMRSRHWAAISETVGFDLRPDDHTSLTRFVDMGLAKWVEQLNTISDSASKEFSIEKSTDAMKTEWNSIEFSTSAYRDSGTHVLVGSGLEDIQTLLDDHIVKTQTMKGSSFAKPFAEAIGDWERWLATMQDVIDNWIQVQTAWLYLEPIFSSDDIMKQMPEEGQMFKQIDGSWRTLMSETVSSPQVRTVSAIPNLLQMLSSNRVMLEKIQKGLNQYLETKRLFFPRFFFLSNDELLEILSETKDPTRVQPHLKKCFEGVAKLEFQENLEITALLSSEEERLVLTTSMNAKDSNGSVERWLSDVEALMFASVKASIQSSLTAYAAEPRSKWVLNWPGQVVLAGSQIFWTQNVEKHIEAGTLQDFLTESNAALAEIIGLIRGPLTRLQRRTLGALVVIDVHARDTVQALVNAQISTIGDFEWQSQLRYYWHDDTVKVRIVNAEVQYGYEYLGNSDRLVITPLTDRCYRTLMGAVQFDLGGAPEGPAGTGKTETVKDLAKAIAIQCVVFNCSDGLDYLAMSKFFKGLASSGAWACFDEFNRIDLEVLSVVAQQVLSIQRAVAARVDHFRFEGTELRLRATCSVFITMNPGYAGRSELPDNLKALFRTVAMMVPNYEMIAEITLYSFGFLEARSLARKIVATFKLCSEQLSSQDHYDYGMRAVKAVLTAAGNLKRNSPDSDESALMLKSIMDVNLPKFLAHDIGLFLGITGDLFPGVQLPSQDHRQLTEAIEVSLGQLGLRPVPAALTKILQLYEMIQVRHGLMLVGGPMSGKTSSIRALSSSLSTIHGTQVDVVTINPKSITLSEIYGQFDAVSREWNDGVLSIHFRRLASSESRHHKWVVFDGPVDTLWIENMNTVLDDNKKLCLMSGEIIQMSPDMNMIFEVADLAVASPATVSRCGMVYMESSGIGTKSLLESWLTTMSTNANFNSISFENLFKRFVPPCLDLVRRKCVEYIPSIDMNLVASFLKLYQAVLADAPENLGSKDSEALFIFALLWSVGGTVDSAGRQRFNTLIRDLVTDMKLSVKVPEKGLLYDYVWLNSSWALWSTSANFSIDPNARIQEIIVPTIDSARYSSMAQLLVRNRISGLFVGPTGTGKTAYITMTLQNFNRDAFAPTFLTFSAQTTASQIREIIDSKMERKRKGIFGPPGQRAGIVFVDDLNMPKPETFGAQPALELLRQWLDHGGWYDVTDASFKTIQDTSLLCAMGPAGGGRHSITSRFSRHFVQLAMTPFDDESLMMIFQSILGWHFAKGFAAEVVGLCSRLVDSTRILFQTAASELLPTPARSHYTFNLRDFAGVIRGLCLSHPEEINDKFSVVRLWVHEVHRVFADRLIDDADAMRFLDWVRKVVSKTLQLDFDTCLSRLDRNNDGRIDTVDEIRGLMFGDYMSKKGSRKPYAEIVDAVHMREVFIMQLEEYNQISGSPINLVLFRYALEHISRIARILKQPGGHGLLVGVGGTGRQSLTRLAAYVAGYRIFQIEMSKNYGVGEWREDLKKILRCAGEKLESTVFLFTDSQIKNETFLEDINAILNSGEVPNLFTAEEKAEICNNLAPIFKRGRRDVEPKPADLTSFFVDMVRQNLHVVLCMSPVGDALRTRLRMFPSFVNCCTIDWMPQWPRNALETVAKEFLADVDISETSRSACITLFVNFHQTLEEMARRYKQELRRYYYATPSSYLELIISFKSLLAEKVKQITFAKNRYEAGLKVLASTADQVRTMLSEIEELRPALIRTGQETDEMIVTIDKETEEAEAIKSSVEKEEAIANEKAAAAKAIADDCAAELAQAMPILESAIAALNTLTKNDLVEVKAMKTPPAGVLVVMEAVCVMMNIPPTRTPDATGKMVKDYWDPAKKKLLSDPKLLTTLSSFDKDNIPRDTIKKISTYIENPLFDPASVKKASKAAFGLCSWVRAMYQYDEVANTIRPKREALDNAKAEYAEVEKGLLAKQAELSSVQAKVAALNEKLQSMQRKKSDLESQVDICGKKLVRGQQLIGGLGGEKERWTEAAAQLSRQYDQVVGDVVLSAGAVAYLGAFTAAYRQQCIDSWAQLCRTSGLQCADRFNLATVLGDPVNVRQWIVDGLPNDAFSIDNAIIIQKARRWPLLIDPQGQANAWIKNMERERKLLVIKLTDADFARRLEGAVQFGIPVLLENVGEELDPTLEPILLKSTYRKGGIMMIKLSDAEIEYSENFRFYVTTKMRNPHYLPELSTKVTLLNFMITPDGLDDQILGIVVAKERPELQAEKNRLIVQSAENKKNLKEIEDEILRVLSLSEGSILDDESAIQVLSASKQISNDIAEKQRISDKTEKEIDIARMGYKPVASHSSVLFFCIADLANIDPMYQYSLSWFLNMFERAIDTAEPSSVLESRLQNLNDHFTFSLFGTVCRSLFEKDKLLFAFLLTVNVLKSHGYIEPEQWRMLLTGGVAVDSDALMLANPCPDWLQATAWSEIQRLSTAFPVFATLAPTFREYSNEWKRVFDAFEPHQAKFPGTLQTGLNSFQKMLVLRCLRPDKIVPAIRDFVAEHLGQKFIDIAPFDLAAAFKDADNTIPLLFILSPGSDPFSSLMKFATDSGYGSRIESISLGQGQGPFAASMIEAGQVRGSWIILQNCHLAISWMPTLERIIESTTASGAHTDYRLWLTSYPSDRFSVSILQRSVKMTNEPPKGLKANLLASYSRDPICDPEFFGSCNHQSQWASLLYGLCFFHGLVQERRAFGALGWNIPYEFTESDLRISIRQLHMFVGRADTVDAIPYKAIRYLIGQCNYGGRVTDDWDRRTLTEMLATCIGPETLISGHQLSESGQYQVPELSSNYTHYVEFCRSLPSVARPEVFGLHDNADITKDRNETATLFRSILLTQARTASTGSNSKEEIVGDIAADILSKISAAFDLESVQARFPVSYKESMNTVLCQDLIRYNRLINIIRRSLADLQKALVGQVVMSSDLEQINDSLFDGVVPKKWLAVSYPTMKPLSSYIIDLVARLHFFQKWIQTGTCPDIFWFSGFFFTQSFLTGILQNYSRKHSIPIDEIGFDFEFVNSDASVIKPQDGAYVNGLFLEGARWDATTFTLAESSPKILFCPAPIIWLKPVRISEIRTENRYDCPVYKTLDRRGTLSTTGHSTNFVMTIKLPTNKPGSHWVRRGVALLTQLND